jgi:uncharacterized integral membrane protein
MLITDLSLFLRILIGHIIGDFVLQSRSMVREKESLGWKSPRLYLHAGLYTSAVFLITAVWADFFWMLPLLFGSHLLIDRWKATRKKQGISFALDQGGHFLILLFIFILLSDPAGSEFAGLFRRIWESPLIMGIGFGYLVILWPVGCLMNYLLTSFRDQLDADSSRGLAPAGFWIGCLERVFLLSFVLLNYPAGVVLLLGLKSLFRFGEIKDPNNRKEAEYIFIGTLLSFGFALVVGVSIRFALLSR